MTSYNPSRRDLANPTLGLRSKPLCRWPAALVLNLVWVPIGACFPSTESAVDCIFLVPYTAGRSAPLDRSACCS